ncbi:MAG: hypothetical protein WB729_03325, partial [Candidatus Sulfotelmatobacter sp.]
MKITKSFFRKVTAFSSTLVLSVVICQVSRADAQAQGQPDPQNRVAALHEPSPGESDAGTTNTAPPATATPATAPDPRISLDTDIAKELAAMRARIGQLELELKNRAAAA